MGVLTFPREFKPEKFNMDLKTFIETGIKTIENIYNSKSWKVTKPIRSVKNSFKKE